MIDEQKLAQILNDPLLFAESILLEPETGKPFKANYAQQQILAALRTHNRVAIRVSRQTGKTYSLTVIAIWAAIRKPYQKILIVAPTLAQTKTLFSNIDRFLDANPLLAGMLTSRTSSPFLQRRFSNGSEINGFTLGSKNKSHGDTTRGQGADVVIIDEGSLVSDEDWVAINPIIEGSLYRPHTIAIVAGTPKLPAGRFYEIFNNDELGKIWHRIHIPISQNPDFKDRIERIRAACPNDIEWITEYEAEFPRSGSTVFRLDDIANAQADYSYALPGGAGGIVAIGVDWDKHEAGVNIAIVEYQPSSNMYYLVWREEVPRSEVVLSEGVARIIELNEKIPNVKYIVVDRGYGDMQVEMLRIEGHRRPGSDLQNKVIGLMFHQQVEVPDPVSGEKRKVRLKDAAISLFGMLLEQGRFKFPSMDTALKRDLMSFHVVAMTAQGPRYSSDRDHAIDAICLALWALRENETVYATKVQSGPPILVGLGDVLSGRERNIRPISVEIPSQMDSPLASRSFRPGAGFSRSFSGVGRRGF